MTRPATVDTDALLDYMREPGAIAAEAARRFHISRVRVGQILKERAPELLPGQKPSPPRVSASEKRAMADETRAALKESENKEQAAAKLGITVSGLNHRIRRLGINDPLKRDARTKRLIAETRRALKAHKTKVAAADALGIHVSGLSSRISRYGLE